MRPSRSWSAKVGIFNVRIYNACKTEQECAAETVLSEEIKLKSRGAPPAPPFRHGGRSSKRIALQSKALREAVTNKVIRSDFVVNGVLEIEMYRNCFVLTNPGLLKLPISQNIMVENKKKLETKGCKHCSD